LLHREHLLKALERLAQVVALEHAWGVCGGAKGGCERGGASQVGEQHARQAAPARMAS
jgi:hypothetical protein